MSCNDYIFIKSKKKHLQSVSHVSGESDAYTVLASVGLWLLQVTMLQ